MLVVSGCALVFSREMACVGMFFVGIRIYWIMGFLGFAQRASLTGKRSFAFVLAGFPVMAKSASRAK